MQKKIMQVFYGNDGLPYKDQERTVHFPIVGTGFTGASDTTEIRFYVDRIGGIYTPTWIANTKLPNGKKGYKLLTTGRDALLGENYVSLSLTSFYTQVKGDVYISLNGYDGGVQLEQDEDENYVLIGTPTIQATGSIKITMQYAVQILPSDIQEYIALDDLLAYISGLATDENVNANFLKRLKLKPTDTDYTTTPLYQLLENEELLTDFTSGNYAIFELEIDMGTNADLYLVSVRLDDNEYGARVYLFEYGDGYRISYGEANTTIENSISVILSQAGYAELATLTDLAQYYKSTQVDTLLAGKVDKTNVAYKLYGTSFNGSQAAITYGMSATQNTIVQRWVDGNVIVPLEPDGNNCATSKKYVDDLISTIKEDNIIVVSTIVYPTLEDFLATTGEEGDIYLYPIDTTDLTKGYYRYIWEGNDWLSMGTTEIDLSDYPTLDGNNAFTGSNSFAFGIWASQIGSLSSGDYISIYGGEGIRLESNDPNGDTVWFRNTTNGYYYMIPDSTNLTSNKYLATEDDLASKQDTLVSGTNIKTINNESILGSGNIDIQGGGGSATWGSITGTLSDQTDLNNALTEIREVAEGKCKAVVISYLDTYSAIVDYLTNDTTKKIYLKSSGEDITNAFISGIGWDSTMIINGALNTNNLSVATSGYLGVIDKNGDYYLYNLSSSATTQDLKVGDIVLVKETDVPDRWFDENGYFFALETTKVDLTNYVDLTSAQTISGVKTFENGTELRFNATSPLNTFYIKGSSNFFRLGANNIATPMIIDRYLTSLRPESNKQQDFGSSSAYWRNAYIDKFNQNTNGYGISLPDTTSWTANKEIATTDQAFNVINASDIVSNTLTQAQYDLITNGKPTLIKGTLLGKTNALIIANRSSSTITSLMYVSNDTDWGWLNFGYLSINISTKVISQTTAMSGMLTLDNIRRINGKDLPANPSSTGTFVLKCVDGTLTWVKES